MPAPRSASSASTASPDEIARFSALADAWWNLEGEFKPLHRLNPPRLNYIRKHVCRHLGRDPRAARPFDGLSVLDVGCGGGLLSEPVANLGARVIGIDAGDKAIGVARVHAERAGIDIDYRVAAPEEFAAKAGGTFDVVLNMEVVEHVTGLDAFLAVAASLMRPQGLMIISTVNRTLKSLALAKVGAEYVLRWLPAGTHDWRKFVRPSELARGLAGGGAEIVDLTGVSYRPLTDEWVPSDDLSVNYMAVAVRR